MTTNDLHGMSKVLYEHQAFFTVGMLAVLAVSLAMLVVLFIRGAHRND